MCPSCQIGSFRQRPGLPRPGVRAGVRHPDGHGAGHRVPRLPSGNPLGPVFVDAGPCAGGTCCRRAHQRSLHWWVWAGGRVLFGVRIGFTPPERGNWEVLDDGTTQRVVNRAILLSTTVMLKWKLSAGLYRGRQAGSLGLLRTLEWKHFC